MVKPRNGSHVGVSQTHQVIRRLPGRQEDDPKASGTRVILRADPYCCWLQVQSYSVVSKSVPADVDQPSTIGVVAKVVISPRPLSP